MFPSNLKYMGSHEWTRCEGDIIVVGVSDYAQAAIQDVVYVELPEVGQKVEQKKEFGVIESVKAAFDLYAPASGEIVATNPALEEAPELVNEDPYGDGWMIKIRLNDSSELGQLLSADEYQAELEMQQEG